MALSVQSIVYLGENKKRRGLGADVNLHQLLLGEAICSSSVRLANTLVYCFQCLTDSVLSVMLSGVAHNQQHLSGSLYWWLLSFSQGMKSFTFQNMEVWDWCYRNLPWIHQAWLLVLVSKSSIPWQAWEEVSQSQIDSSFEAVIIDLTWSRFRAWGSLSKLVGDYSKHDTDTALWELGINPESRSTPCLQAEISK